MATLTGRVDTAVAFEPSRVERFHSIDGWPRYHSIHAVGKRRLGQPASDVVEIDRARVINAQPIAPAKARSANNCNIKFRFVAGVANNRREDWGRAEIRQLSGCQRATYRFQRFTRSIDSEASDATNQT